MYMLFSFVCATTTHYIIPTVLLYIPWLMMQALRYSMGMLVCLAIEIESLQFH